MKVVTGFFVALGVIALLVAIFVLISYCLFLLTPDIKAQIGTGQVSADAAKSFTTKLDNFKIQAEEAAAAKEKKEISFSITDEEVNSKIVETIAEGKFPFKEMLVSFNEDLCWVYFVYSTPAADAKVGMVLNPEINKGNIKVNVMDFSLGKLPVPKSVNTRIADLLNVLINLENPTNDIPIELEAINIANNQCTFQAVTIPAE